MEYIAKTLSDTEAFALRLAETLKGNETIALFGDLGAGKTTFVRYLCKALGITNGVHSPTFAIVNEYMGKFPVYHFDMYRITDEDDLYSTGYYDYLGKGLVIIEWSENIEDYLPKDALKLELRYGEEENTRIFKGKK
ncbi:MAG: tRNA (adenosine(37)-N6)-threonylcarbamoyltransferase complex ATPase subunit type 1 TsaE [Eubacteriales bacterium]|nr:tRNA (adenosine(37)-N6)-threonylcarbamoyltransferase complex ATPase subunit type 1 TsaE [Eubacteriales bacterium]